MGPDLDLHPDTVHRLSGLARNAAEYLGAPVPEPPPSLGPIETEAVRQLARCVRRAADELAAFATAAEICAVRAVGADRLAAAAIRSAGGGPDRVEEPVRPAVGGTDRRAEEPVRPAGGGTGRRAEEPVRPAGGGTGCPAGEQRGGPVRPARGDRDAG